MTDDTEKLGQLLKRLETHEQLSEDQRRILHDFSEALVERQLHGLGIDALADFMVFLRALNALAPLRKWFFRILAGVGAWLLFWENAKESIARFFAQLFSGG